MAIASSRVGSGIRNFLRIAPQRRAGAESPMPKYPPKVALEDSFNFHLEECTLHESSPILRSGGILYRGWSSGGSEEALRSTNLNEKFDSSNPKTFSNSLPASKQGNTGLSHQFPGSEAAIMVGRQETRAQPASEAASTSTAPKAKRLILASFIDPLDAAIGTYNPSKVEAECRAAPPIGILNSPYGMNGCTLPPDPNDPSYDSDWEERLFDPVPGAGVYAGELIDAGKRPKDWNVVYISLDWSTGKVVVQALPYNRRGVKIGLHEKGRVVSRVDIELRKGFGERWAWNQDDEALEEIKTFCKVRLEKKAQLDGRKELRFAEEVKNFWEVKNAP